MLVLFPFKSDPHWKKKLFDKHNKVTFDKLLKLVFSFPDFWFPEHFCMDRKFVVLVQGDPVVQGSSCSSHGSWDATRNRSPESINAQNYRGGSSMLCSHVSTCLFIIIVRRRKTQLVRKTTTAQYVICNQCALNIIHFWSHELIFPFFFFFFFFFLIHVQFPWKKK